MTAGEIREQEVIRRLREIDSEAEDRWTLLFVKTAISSSTLNTKKPRGAFHDVAAAIKARISSSLQPACRNDQMTAEAPQQHYNPHRES